MVANLRAFGARPLAASERPAAERGAVPVAASFDPLNAVGCILSSPRAKCADGAGEKFLVRARTYGT